MWDTGGPEKVALKYSIVYTFSNHFSVIYFRTTFKTEALVIVLLSNLIKCKKIHLASGVERYLFKTLKFSRHPGTYNVARIK